MSRRRSIDELTDAELRLNLYVTQLIVVVLALGLGWLLFDHPGVWLSFWKWDWAAVLLWGGGAAIAVVIADYAAMKVFPEEWFDDGGVNERIFRGTSILQLFFLTLIIGTAEELLFRGVLQTQFGLWLSSLIFAVLHIRYVRKPFLFLFVLCISVLFGWLFRYTGNLLVTIFAHFLVDFIMGLHLRSQEEPYGEAREGE